MPYGIIKQVKNDYAVVALERQEMCGECHACEMLSGKKTCQLTCLNKVEGNVGDEVEIALAERKFLKATYIMYGIPFIGFLVGFLGGYGLSILLHATSKDLYMVFGSVLGMGLCFLYIKIRESKKAYQKDLPQIVAIRKYK